MTEKNTTLPSQKPSLKKVKVENEKINKLLINILTHSITVLNKVIYAGAKLVSDKIIIIIMSCRQHGYP